jgi:hypothetical protein
MVLTSMRHVLPFLAVLLLASLPAVAQGILPNSFAGWTATSKGGFAPAPDNSPGSAAAVAAAREYNFVSGEQGQYTKGAETLQVVLYEMKDPSGAYGEYSYLRTPDMPHSDWTAHSCTSRERALILIGNLVLDIRGNELPRLGPELKFLVATVGTHTKGELFPTLWQHLPLTGFIERTDHYILGPMVLDQFLPIGEGDWLGFSNGAEAETARYRLKNREVTLLIADFPTPQLAAKKLNELEQKYSVNAQDPQINTRNVYASRSLTLLAIVAGARSKSEADTLLDQVHSGTELTWNEPSIEFKEPSFGAMIVGVFVGTGILCLFALISSLAFGGFRLFVKRLLPNKVFDRSSQLQILQLGLSSKPINAEDFYSSGGSPPR